MHKDVESAAKKLGWKRHGTENGKEIWGPRDVPLRVPLHSSKKLTTYAVKNQIAVIKRTERKAQKLRNAKSAEEVEMLLKPIPDPDMPCTALEIADSLGCSEQAVHNAGLHASSIQAKWAIVRRVMNDDLRNQREWPGHGRYAHHLVPLVERNLWAAYFKALDAGENPTLPSPREALKEEEAEMAAPAPPKEPEAPKESKQLDELKLEVSLYEETLNDRNNQLDKLRLEHEHLQAQHKALEERHVVLEKNAGVLESDRDKSNKALREVKREFSRLKREKAALEAKLEELPALKSEPNSALGSAMKNAIQATLQLREGMEYDDEQDRAYITMGDWVRFQNALIDYYRKGGQ